MTELSKAEAVALRLANRVEFVSYDGASPSLCSGELILEVDGMRFVFSRLNSGGSAGVTPDGEEHCNEGEWEIREWPPGFPADCQQEALDLVNAKVPHGCCGGCI